MAGIADHVKVEIAFGIAPLDTAALAIPGNWTDVTSACRLVDVTTSSRTSEFEGFVAGRCMLTLDNQTRLYDPLNATGAHFGQFDRYTPIRVTALKTSNVVVWSGYARKFTPTYAPHPDAVTVITGGDLLWLMADWFIDTIPTSHAGDTVDARVLRLLTTAGMSSFAALDSSTTTLQATTYGDTLLALCTSAVQADGGFLFHDPAANKIQFDTRNAVAAKATYTTSVLTLDDSTAPTFMRDTLVVEGTPDNFRNLITVTPTGGEAQVVDKTVVNGATRSFARTLDMETTSQASGLANFWADLYSTPHSYVAQVQARPATTTGSQRPTVLDVGLRNRITVSFSPPGGGAAVSADVFVDKIRHTITASDWVTTFGCSSADAYDSNLAGTTSLWLVVGDATRGKVATNQLGY